MTDHSGLKVLPWTKPASLKDFVPNHSRIIVLQHFSLFIAWRDEVALILTFQNAESLSTKQPIQSQAVTSKQKILDIVKIGTFIYFVGVDGLFQILCAEGKDCRREILEHLGECKNLALCEAFELSPLKKLLAVVTFPENLYASFAAVTCARNDGEINAEVYAISWDRTSRGECKLRACHYITCWSLSSGCPDRCFCSFLCNKQFKAIISDHKDTEVLLIGLKSGQLYCFPIILSSKSSAIRPTARLLYQSHWPIIGIASPSDGCSIFIFLHGGTVMNIFPHSNSPNNSSGASLSFKMFSLPYSLKCFAVFKHDLMVTSDSVTTNVVHWVPPNDADVEMTSLRGVTSISVVPNLNLAVVSTLHNVFYILDPSHSVEQSPDICLPWEGGNLDVSLKILQEMKNQTELLSQLRLQLEEEDCIIKALSAVARAPLLGDCFPITVKVVKTHEDQEIRALEKNNCLGNDTKTTENTYQISVEIRNESEEDFTASLWQINLDIKNPDGSVFSRSFYLPTAFTKANPFSAVLNVPYSVENITFPIQVKASLVAELKENDVDSHWLSINLGQVALDVSYFFSLSFQPPHLFRSEVQNIAEFIKQMHFNSSEGDNHKEELKEKELMTNYVLSIPENFRKPRIIIEKLLSNCHHINNHLDFGNNFNYQSEKTALWLSIFGKTLQIVFRKSCASITLSSSYVDILHSVKLFLSTIFDKEAGTVLEIDADSSNAAHIRAKKLNAILRTQSIDEALDSKKLLIIHQDLRNNVSSIL